MNDLHVGDKLSGTVRNVVDFGAFVDIGLHEDGLVHTTRMSMRRNVDPMSVVSVGDIVDVWVYELDEARGRVSLSMLEPSQLEQRDAAYKHRKSSKNTKNKKKDEKPKKKEVTMDDAMARLMERFGK